MIKPIDNPITTTGSTLRPGDSSVYNLSMVLELPPAPAERVEVGRALEALSALSWAALRRIAVAGPPGGFGDEGRAVLEPVEGELTGEVGLGDDCGGGC